MACHALNILESFFNRNLFICRIMRTRILFVSNKLGTAQFLWSIMRWCISLLARIFCVKQKWRMWQQAWWLSLEPFIFWTLIIQNNMSLDCSCYRQQCSRTKKSQQTLLQPLKGWQISIGCTKACQRDTRSDKNTDEYWFLNPIKTIC